MINFDLAKILYRMAEYMEMNDVQFKPRAYEKVSQEIEGMSDDVVDLYKQNGREVLLKISGVGEGIADKIEEYIKTGKIKEYEKLKKECPVNLDELGSIEGLGPKKIKALYHELKIKNLADLESAAKAGKISKLEHFGYKSEQNILQGIEFQKKGQGRFLLLNALALSQKFEERLLKLRGVSQAVTAGSIRRRKDTIGDIDILVVAKDAKLVMDYFTNMAEVDEILAKGNTKTSVKLKNGLDADLRVVDAVSFGSALQYFTGSKDHNVALRKIAQEKDLKLNEYGLTKIQNSKGKGQNYNLKLKSIAGRTEEEIYEVLGLKYIEPELREMRGEIQISQNNKLPKLIELNDIKGDLQMHSTWSDGAYSIKEMAEEAIKLGYEYIAITDHIGHLSIAGAMSQAEIKKQWAEIDKLNKEYKGKIVILKGGEVDINVDGSMACSEEILAQLDIVLGSLHSQFKMPKDEITARVVRAMENKHVDIIAHPTTRVIGKRDEVAFDWEKIFQTAKQTKTILEINCYPDRADLSDINAHRAIDEGVMLSMGTDAHSKEHLQYMQFGVYQARRAWAEKKNIINTFSLSKMLEQLK